MACSKTEFHSHPNQKKRKEKKVRVVSFSTTIRQLIQLLIENNSRINGLTQKINETKFINGIFSINEWVIRWNTVILSNFLFAVIFVSLNWNGYHYRIAFFYGFWVILRASVFIKVDLYCFWVLILILHEWHIE